MTIDELILEARAQKCSDIHLTYELRPVFRVYGTLKVSDIPIQGVEVHDLILSMCDNLQREIVLSGKDLDFCYCVKNTVLRQRVNIFHQQGKLAAVLRLLNDTIPSFDSLNLPTAIRKLADEPRGLVLVTGPTGSGKSTTLAAMIDYINQNKREHILTVEDPIEYVYNHGLSVVHQREVGVDVSDFSAALRSSLREDPDVILVGEMRDYETISAAITAAETGHLVFSTLHTTGAAATVDRIIDVFPAAGQQQIRTQLASTLKGVITQNLIPLENGGGRVAAFEIMLATDAICNVIRESKCYQIPSLMQTGRQEGMQSLNFSLAQLVLHGKISRDAANERATDKDELRQYLS